MNRIKQIAQSILCLLLILLMSTGYSIGQQKKYMLKGVVVEKNTSIPLPGASISIKGKQVGTITDPNGNFKLRVSPKDVIVISFIGFISRQIAVEGQKQVNVALDTDNAKLEEVVVTGYGTTKAKDITGSVKSVRLKNIQDNAATSVDQMLQGRLAGVRLNMGEGSPGQFMNFEIRGSNSITGSSDPLFVVDGFPQDDPSYVSTISPDDIERVDILKDASATAIYGARGANGVVIISTKKGTLGSTKISFSVQEGINEVPHERRLDVLSPYEFVTLQKEMGATNWGDIEQYRSEKGTNWQDEIFRYGRFKRYNLNLMGGSKKTRFFTSFGFVDEQGSMIETGFKRYTGRLKLDHDLNKRAKIGINVAYTNTEYSGMKISTEQVSAVKSAIMFRPVLPFDSDLDLDENDEQEVFDAGYFPPVKTLENTDRSEPRDVVQVNGLFDYKITKNLKFHSTVGYTYDAKAIKIFYNEGTNQAERGVAGINGSLKNIQRKSWVNENTLSYNVKKGGHKLSVLGGVTFQETTIFTSFMQSNNFPFDDFGWNDFSMGIYPQISHSNLQNRTLMSGLSRVNYNYKEKYLLTASFRVDGSSKFPKENKFGYFPSFAVAWRAGEEPLIKNLNLFSNLKVKGGYGATGNNRIGDFDAIVTYGTGMGTYWGNKYYPGVAQNKLANTDLKWETTQQVNAGIDMGFVNNRITLEAEAYYKYTNDLLLDALVPPSVGFTGVKENRGSIINKGVELSLNTVNFHTKDFQWNSSFNISFNRNKVDKLSQGESQRLYNPNVGNIFSEEKIYGLFVGESVGVMYGYKYDGLYQLDDFVHDPQNNELTLKEGVVALEHNAGELGPGMPKYKDLNGDGKVNENDRTVIGNPHPKHFGGFHNYLRYKGIDLSVLLTWSYGNDIFNGNRSAFGVVYSQKNRNYLGEVANRWTPENPVESGVWRAPFGDNNYIPVYKGKMMSDYWIEDGSYIRIKNVALGYSIPREWLNKHKIEKLRLSLSVDNLFVFSKYSGYDPEVSVKSEALYQGIDYSAYPRARTYTLGLNLTF